MAASESVKREAHTRRGGGGVQEGDEDWDDHLQQLQSLSLSLSLSRWRLLEVSAGRVSGEREAGKREEGGRQGSPCARGIDGVISLEETR